MNERIKEIAEQAYLVYEIPYESSVVDSTVVSTYKHRQFDKEKFAELIIRECVEVCGGIAAVRAGYNDVDGRDTAYSCGDMIKEHFGIE